MSAPSCSRCDLKAARQPAREHRFGAPFRTARAPGRVTRRGHAGPLPFTVRIDFEGDQWTFFKFPHADLLTLYGLDVQEMNPWLSLVGHVEEQVALGRPVLVELDSYYLPDTLHQLASFVASGRQ